MHRKHFSDAALMIIWNVCKDVKEMSDYCVTHRKPLEAPGLSSEPEPKRSFVSEVRDTHPLDYVTFQRVESEGASF